MKRKVDNVIDAIETSDGDGVKIFRSIGSYSLPQLDPFLLLDELKSNEAKDYIGGFPPHPHRGFETVTYMLEGEMRHKDSAGNEGVIGAGDVQWMTAGSGIIHSEMPEQDDGRLWGFQLWINLPSSQKMRAPRYQEIPSANIPEVDHKNTAGRVRVLAGQVDGVVGSVKNIATRPLLLDIKLRANEKYTFSVPLEHAAIVYVYKGSLNISGDILEAQQLGYLSLGESIEINAESDGVGALVLAAAPLNEPVARRGPFVMSTQEELERAFLDYRQGNLVQ